VNELPPLDHLAHLRAAADAFAAVLDEGPLDAPVAGCPGWDVRRLGVHLGIVHRWAAAAARTAEPPRSEDYDHEPGDDVDLAQWYRAAAGDLLVVLAGLDPDAPTWHPFPVALRASLWPRRQAHETTVHRWDAQQAVATSTGRDPDPIDAVLAADGIDEYFGVMLPRLLVRRSPTLPVGTLGVHCTDAPGGWLVAGIDGRVEIVGDDPAGADALVTGPASDVLLRLWGRPAGPIRRDGDPAVADAWLALGAV
jgi:uncharacterized protein (TIGR03083 family)